MNEPQEGPQREMSEPEYREEQRKMRMANASQLIGQMDAVTADQFIQAAISHVKVMKTKDMDTAQQKSGPSREYYSTPGINRGSRGLASSAPSTPPPSLPVPAAIHEQDVEVASLHQALQELEQRLSPVLSMQDLAGGGSNASPTPSSIADRIASNNYTIRGLYAQVRGILDRLHL